MNKFGRMPAVFAVACLVVTGVGASVGGRTQANAASLLAFSVANVGPYGGEPSIVSDRLGRLYDTTPSGGTLAYTSTDSGGTWKPVATADPSSLDDCLATDQLNSVYLCNLDSSFQADVWKSVDHGSSWTHGAGVVVGSVCGSSCSPFGVDRPWTAASILPPATTTSQAEVVLMYHDLYGPSQIYVNISHDGGASFGAPQLVLASPNVTTGAKGTLVAQGDSFCNTVPAGVGIAPPGSPHAGRIFVAWIAADLAQNATGCNVTMTQSFHTLWVSYSDDNGLTWTPQQAFDAGIGHDASTPFAAFTLDNEGNPYVAFANNFNSNPATCSAESSAGTVQGDTSCEYDMYVVWSKDGGATWDGGGGLIPGSAGKPYRVNPRSETGTHFFPAIAASNPGQVDVAYLRTPEIEPTDPLGKVDPGGCAGPSGNPPTYPPPCKWHLYAGQSLNLTADPEDAGWTTLQVTSTPMHIGDICNLGIFCVAPSSNRHLLDFMMEAFDPQGCAHIAYADDNTVNMLRVANQTAGCLPAGASKQCHEGDGSGHFRGNRGDGDVEFDSDGCLDGDPDHVDSDNRGDGKDFHSTRIDSIALNPTGSVLTVQGVGISGGLPVAFVMVATPTMALSPGSVSYTFSDGFSNTGNLVSGSILLH